MILLLLTAIIYASMAFISSSLFHYLPVPLFIGILYVAPLVINFTVYKIQKRDWKILTAILAPTFSVAFYLLFAYLTSATGAWYDFAMANTISDTNMSLKIETNLFESSQILFVGVLFYGLSIAYHFIVKKSF